MASRKPRSPSMPTFRGSRPADDRRNFRSQTRAVTIAFQKANGLDPDGVIGPKTREKLGLPAVSAVAASGSFDFPTSDQRHGLSIE